MPIQEYIAQKAPGCALCCYGFERLEAAGEPILERCTACGGAVRRVIGAPAVIEGGAHRLSERHLAAHGFSQYRRVGKGEYEKTVGDGPDRIDARPGKPSS
jgi:hypothetical protein